MEPPKFSVKVPDKIESPPVVGDDNEEKGAALDQGANTGVELEEDTIDVDGFTLDFNSFLAK